MAITKIKQVYGNVLRVAIPLTQRVRTMVDGVETEEEFDFYPSPDYPVMIDLYKGGGLHQTFTATMHENVATFVDEGTIPIGVYQLEVRCRDMQGHPCRYMVRAIIVIVDATIDAGIEAGIEFNSETYTLEGTVFYYAKGDTGVGIERIEQITESEENGGVNVIRVTLTDGTYSDFNVRNGRLTPNQEERLAKIESDYVIWSFTRDGNTFNTDDYKYSDIVDIRNSGRVLHIRMINADGSGEERLFVDANEESNRFTAYYCEGKGEIAKSEIVGAKVYYLTRGDNDSINVSEINYESLLQPYLGSILYKGSELANRTYVRDQNLIVRFDLDNTITCDTSITNIITSLNANKRVIGEADLVNHTLFTPSYFADNIVVFDFISPIDGKRSTLFGVNNNNVDTWQLTEGQVYSKPTGGIPKSDLDSNVQASLNKADNTYTRAQVDALIRSAQQLTFVVVATLPTPSESTTGKIYLVPSSTPAQSNVRDEWITITVGGVYRWELIGSTSVDLTQYTTKDYVDSRTKMLKLISISPLQWQDGHETIAKAMLDDIYDANRSNTDTNFVMPIFYQRNGYVYTLGYTRLTTNNMGVITGARNVFHSTNASVSRFLTITTNTSGDILSIEDSEDDSVQDKITYYTSFYSLQKHSDGSISFYDTNDNEVDFHSALSDIINRFAIVKTNEYLDVMGEGEQTTNNFLLFIYQKEEPTSSSWRQTYHHFVGYSRETSFYHLTLLESRYNGEHTLELDDFEEVSFVQLMSNGKIDPYLFDDSTKASLALADSALQSETDPTVPSWAKQATKPSYTAQEVGALPNTTTIPTSLSQLTDDATHRTVSDTEKSTWNNKSNFSGNYNDLTNKPTIPAAQVNSDWNANSGVAQILNKPTIPTVPAISTDISSDATSDTKTASPKAVKTYADSVAGDTNVIETVKVNSTALTPDANKAVDVKTHDAVVNHGTSDTTFALTPNVLHTWGTVTALTLTLATPTDNTIVNEYMVQFTSGATATTLSLPSTITWVATPNIQANKTYQVSIINNLGVIAEF